MDNCSSSYRVVGTWIDNVVYDGRLYSCPDRGCSGSCPCSDHPGAPSIVNNWFRPNRNKKMRYI